MTLTGFTNDDKVAALQRAGYEVKVEKIMVLEGKDHDNEVERVVLNVYLNGELMCPWGAAGTYRVDWMFNRELEKRLLSLF